MPPQLAARLEAACARRGLQLPGAQGLVPIRTSGVRLTWRGLPSAGRRADPGADPFGRRVRACPGQAVLAAALDALQRASTSSSAPSSSGSNASPGRTVGPTATSGSRTGRSPTARRRRCATRSASAAPVSGSSTRNSSPPIRPRWSVGRRDSCKSPGNLLQHLIADRVAAALPRDAQGQGRAGRAGLDRAPISARRSPWPAHGGCPRRPS
jgi:hypothetical protein